MANLTSTQPQQGGGCYSSVGFQVNDGWRPNMGGLVVENVWEGEIIIGGDLRVTGCNAGSSVEGSGGQSAVVSIVSGLCAIPLRAQR
jgi:anaerobic glycerol-3-phosphate dehydrogenase